MQHSKPTRIFLPQDFKLSSWEQLQPYFESLVSRDLNTAVETEEWLKERSELDAVLEEDMAWRYIKMNIDTTDEALAKEFEFFVQEIEPKMAPYDHKLNVKLIESKGVNLLDVDTYKIYLRGVKRAIEIFREENIALEAELTTLSQKYGTIAAKMAIEHEGEELTMQKGASLLRSTDRDLRESVYHKLQERRAQDRDALDSLFTELIEKRTQLAKNAGFENYRDYMFAAMGRFDYGPEDCFQFHDAIEKEIVPIIEVFQKERKQQLGLDVLKPWDTSVDPNNLPPLKPFEKGDDLLAKSITCFEQLDPYFSNCLKTMEEMGHLDLDSKKGKAPGGFNYPMYEVGAPFIYMNAVGSLDDVVTMVHEGGHAIHSFLTHPLELTTFKSFPSEVAELASMSMELMSSKHWDVFLPDADDLKRAKKDHLKRVLGVLPWVAAIDKFQHWIYTNPTHTVAERHAQWTEIITALSGSELDWTGLEQYRDSMWQAQLHLYEVPFYYIEYGMAQLGAIAVWRNFMQDQTKAIADYKAGLSLGYTKSIGEIYQTAGVKFDFSPAYVKELASFVKDELSKLD
jgi:oligoendopeptidase F